jgi:hypothetical protein
MENQTGYDLNAAIESWRQELAAQGNLTVEVRRELETHLRDAIAGFQQRGLNCEESFWLACKRVGQPPQLGEEFAKADPAAVWRERVFWMALASVLIYLWKTLTDDLFFLMTNKAVRYFSPSILRGTGYPLVYSCFTMLSILLVVWFFFFLAQGGAHKWRFVSRLIVCSRTRFFFVFLTLIFAAYIFEALNFLPSPKPFSISTKAIIEQAFMNFCLHASLPLALVAVSAWLMPTQNREMPKRA